MSSRISQQILIMADKLAEELIAENNGDCNLLVLAQRVEAKITASISLKRYWSLATSLKSSRPLGLGSKRPYGRSASKRVISSGLNCWCRPLRRFLAD